MKKIALTHGGYACVDDAGYGRLAQWSWYIGNRGYALARVDGKGTLMHRLIVCAPEGMSVDHINRNKLDNRRVNLRICDQSLNMFNQKLRSNNKSGLRGVSWDTAKGKWFASVRKNNKTYYCGRYADKLEAYIAYLKMAAELYV